MIELIREWLMGVTGAAVLAALVQAVTPEGGVKQVGKLVCGLVLISAVLAPLGRVEATNFSLIPEYDEQRMQLQKETEDQMKTIIEQRLGAYSMDKARQLGLHPEMQVMCVPDEAGAFLPRRVVLWMPPGEDAEELVTVLCADFGMTKEQFDIREGGA